MGLFNRLQQHLSPKQQRVWFKGLLYKQFDTVAIMAQLAIAAWAITHLGESDNPMLPLITLGLLVILLLLRFTFMARALCKLTIAAYGLGIEIRRSLLQRLVSMSVATIRGLSAGKIALTLSEDVQWQENQSAYTTPQIACQVMMLTLIYLALFWFDWVVAGSALLVLMVGMFILGAIRKKLDEILRLRATMMADVSEAIVEYAQGMSFIRAAAATTTVEQRFDREIDQLRVAFRRGVFRSIPLLSLFYIIIDTSVVVGILAGALRFNSPEALTLSEILITILLLFATITPLRGIIPLLNITALTQVGETHIAEIEAVATQASGPLAAPDKYDVEVNNISFSYPGTNQPAIQNVSFYAPQGSMTAIVGLSGSGKSTLAYLLLSFYQLDKGEIRLGGNNIHHYQTQALYDTVTMVFQETALFQDTVANNLRLGDPGATQLELEQAARLANIHDTIMALPQGYDTPLGVDGGTLSGGERQRLAIARAILKQSPVLFLDEATASLDPENEQLIQQAFDSLTQNKTVFVIAHRLSTITRADQILVMDHGTLCDSGTHNELLGRCSLYQSLWENHLGSEEHWHLYPNKPNKV
ncbi:ABC transporter permease [Photorhabdus sp. HUG-39]|uniref:ATP-binding cassette domain-containing protein n=2 Tax=Morganellaceae TaxID=1903414 RepID=A0ABX0B2V7_9GAMM|nr:ABC transporter ATP-binding protein [Photorhabdus bodei]NDL13265.1 ATP-binding cassette domain-containing protein [Photorhabdus kayaii]NDL26994.1 ATP-binding cassette domain-containing protein [Photorhabdus kayaii]RAX08132.1 ABC transporter permease [Photorhabdus sp. HUG-39]